MYPNIPWTEGVNASTYVYTRFLPELRRHVLDAGLPAPLSPDTFHDTTTTSSRVRPWACVFSSFLPTRTCTLPRATRSRPLFVRFIDDVLAIFLEATQESVKAWSVPSPTPT